MFVVTIRNDMSVLYNNIIFKKHSWFVFTQINWTKICKPTSSYAQNLIHTFAHTKMYIVPLKICLNLYFQQQKRQ